MTRRPPALRLTAPGGPFGWPIGEPSWEDATRALSRRTGAPCHVFAVDQAAQSGWALHDLARIVDHGTVSGTHQMRDLLASLADYPGFALERCLVVFEDHAAIPVDYRARFDPRTGEGPKRNPQRTMIGLGAALGAWRTLLDLAGHPSAQRMLVTPSEWRRVLRGCRFGQADDWKSAAVRYATALTRHAMDSDDEAEAVVMSVWGAVDGLHRWAKKRLAQNAERRGGEP